MLHGDKGYNIFLFEKEKIHENKHQEGHNMKGIMVKGIGNKNQKSKMHKRTD